MGWEQLTLMILEAALGYIKGLNKPLDQITYEDLKNFRTAEQALEEAGKKKG